MMSGVNYVIYGCSSARSTPDISLYRSLTLDEKYCWRNLKRQIENQTLYTCRLFLLNLLLNLPTESTYKMPPFIKVAIFSDVILILVSNYHGCKGEAISLIPHSLIDIVYKSMKPFHLEKL